MPSEEYLGSEEKPGLIRATAVMGHHMPVDYAVRLLIECVPFFRPQCVVSICISCIGLTSEICLYNHFYYMPIMQHPLTASDFTWQTHNCQGIYQHIWGCICRVAESGYDLVLLRDFCVIGCGLAGKFWSSV